MYKTAKRFVGVDDDMKMETVPIVNVVRNGETLMRDVMEPEALAWIELHGLVGVDQIVPVKLEAK